MQDLQTRIALVTGASSGIGAACARKLAQTGARLLLAARRIDRLESLAAELREYHGVDCFCVELDVSKRAAVAETLASLPSEWQAIDIIINNAGLAAGLDRVAEANIDDWEQMIDVNVKGLLYVTRQILPGMIERKRGHIVNIASTAGHIVYPGGSVYCATKHAVRSITKALQLELMDSPLRVSSVDPGLVQTEFSEVRFKGDKEKAENPYRGIIPLSAEDVADAVWYCVSRPAHVQVAEIVLLACNQGDGRSVHRES